MNEIVDKWEKAGLNLGIEACDSIILCDKIKNSITLTNVIQVYEMMEKILSIKHRSDSQEYNRILEDIMSVVINIDNDKLSLKIKELSRNKETDYVSITSNREEDEVKETVKEVEEVKVIEMKPVEYTENEIDDGSLLNILMND